MSELSSILNGETAEAPAAAAPVAGRERKAVTSGGSSVLLQVGESIEAYYRGHSMVEGKYGPSKLHKFELIAPVTLTVITRDPDTKVKSEERKDLLAGSIVTTFLKGNGDWAIGAVAEGTDIELRRLEDGVLPKGHKFEGTKVQTFEVLA